MDRNLLATAFNDIPKKNINLIACDDMREPLKVALEELNKTIEKVGLDIITPPIKDIFACFRKVNNIRVVLIGQDPFPQNGRATGYSFSVPYKIGEKKVAIPPSTRNIYKCLMEHKLMEQSPAHGNLEHWAEQGVLMLNAALTTEVGKSNVHKWWNAYTDKLIQTIDKNNDNIAYILLGNFAKEKKKLITNATNTVFEWKHPSPLSSVNQLEHPENFTHCTCFTSVNTLFTERGEVPIDWNPDGKTIVNIQKKPAVVYKTIPRSEAFFEKSDTNVFGTYKPDVEPATRDRPSPGQMFIFTDGAAKANSKPAICTAGWGFYMTGVNDKKETITQTVKSGPIVRIDATKDTTVVHPSNQRGELMAVLEAMKTLRDWLDEAGNEDIMRYMPVLLVSDSQYTLNIITKWWNSWVSRGTLDGKKNLDIIRPMMELIDGIRNRVIFSTRHIRSHRQEPNRGTYEWFLWYGNEVADKAANNGVKKGNVVPKP